MPDRLSYQADLEPIIGSTFQPTGFPDIGAATFTRFENGEEVDSLLVESVQSMANRLEATAWDDASDRPASELDGLPWVRVIRAGTGEFLTSSRLEAHRLASPFVHASTLDGEHMFDVIKKRLGLEKDTPLDRRSMARAVAALDPLCLVHGVFFSQKEWWGQPKFERAVSAVIEAHDVRRADSGGRKADRVRHQLSDELGGTAEGYGSVPYPRTEWTARHIRAYFVVDTELLRSYGLPDPVQQLLESIALWEIRSLLDGSLRLRTACDLAVVGEVKVRAGERPLPSLSELNARIKELVPQCSDIFGPGNPLTVEWADKGKKK
ncbi:type I-U CRISPR-associated protein Cas7 [Actinobacteria bacterium YIM 96077]|uniref:Type I-U CRISPR-associated protein Cas7 n=1 Tax=Phytoactinopolyspora halophila TaxID=1981511 RepID=A0A329QCB7_9ACTN|nr:type I-U CRISPR-associated RAMP protein Csb1/Cas7u [Phytoactinopolyspora halophila]AYY13993.1 type I-U CRISPR-associated protein Cas7 [Actinobacteria bacterium YIM 96077]RAW10030.1 type I-U CRISPR-associated protein Cas7 [Phytoactinopolyspora halophila]